MFDDVQKLIATWKICVPIRTRERVSLWPCANRTKMRTTGFAPKLLVCLWSDIGHDFGRGFRTAGARCHRQCDNGVAAADRTTTEF